MFSFLYFKRAQGKKTKSQLFTYPFVNINEVGPSDKRFNIT